MNAKKRYILVLLSVAFLLLCYYGGRRLRKRKQFGKVRKKPEHFVTSEELDALGAYHEPSPPSYSTSSSCRMETCFNFTKCANGHFKVYVYPLDENVPPSGSYMKIINSLIASRHFTSDPNSACLFVLSLDTLDRDGLSQDYVRNMPDRIQKLDYFNGGQNHIIFNLYSGTWPDYTEDLGFDIGKAILAKASMSDEHYRPGFDISLPLFHKHHPEKGGEPGLVRDTKFPVDNKYFVAFKGKRYVHGIGSDTRNSLFHLHNGEDMVMVTTCKHGKNWRAASDERCEEDNETYERWDYDNLLSNSTFCLVPRGRRLGSFRFLETLQAGCVPVLLSNSWQLPFGEVIDWRTATIQPDERLLLQVPEILHSLTASQVFRMKQQTQVFWDRYLSSVDKIVSTTLEIVRQRVAPHTAVETAVWNSHPGVHLALVNNTQSTTTLPFFQTTNGNGAGGGQFSAVITTQLSPPIVSSSSPIFRLIKNIADCRSVTRITVLWTADAAPPPLSDWSYLGGFPTSTQLQLVLARGSTVSERFAYFANSDTAAVLSVNDDTSLSTDEIDFAFSVWLNFPDRIVGFPARSHFWDDVKRSWRYSSKMSNEYSMVLTSAAFLHRYYGKLYADFLPESLRRTVDNFNNCEDILLNFLVSHVTHKPPVKVTQGRRSSNKEVQQAGVKNPWADPQHFQQRQTCINTFVAGFGYMPLVHSQTRLDPLLFKDPVSNLRKKYRKIELVQSAGKA